LVIGCETLQELMEQSDKQLLLACRRGDERAWESLVSRYQRLIYTIPRRAGLDHSQTADVFQEVFTTLFEKLDKIDQPERLQAWLVTTTRRKTWRAIAKGRDLRETIADTDDVEHELISLTDKAPLPDEVLLRLEEQHRIRIAVASLDDRCRKLIKMLFYTAAPPSYEEIGKSLKISTGSIGPTRARCLEKLLRLLDG
jgi:RNA polymerase sigma factor (sigma-70 family)